jgi:hypothetical protein
MRLFSRRKKDSAESSGDMRTTPVDNPLDWRPDGSIRKGDPAWDFMMKIIESGKAGIANQRPDGTWKTELLGDDDADR